MRRMQAAVWWTTTVVFVLGGPLVGLVAGGLASRIEHERAWALCSTYFSERSADLLQESRVLLEELLHLRSLFQAEPDVTREQFGLYTKEVLQSHPAIQAIEWAPRIPASQRESHERQALTQGLRDYRIMALAPGGRLVSAPPQQTYFPVFYVEPSGSNQGAIGFDLSSETTRSAALTLAVKTRTVSLSGTVELVQDARGASRGFLAFLPVYRMSADNSRASQNEPDGVILLVVRVQDLLRQILVQPGTQDVVPMHLEVVDESDAGKPVTIGSVTSAGDAHGLTSRALEETLDVGGRRWRLVGRPTDAFLSRHLTRWPWMLGIGTFLFWEASGGLALLLLARRKDSAQHRQARVYEAAVRNLAEGVIVAETDGRFALFNPSAERILGIGKTEVDPSRWSSTYGCFYPDARTPFPPEQLPLARALQGEESQQELFIRNQRVPEGVWIVVSGTPLKNEQNGLEGGVVVLRDITTWKKSSEELRRLSSAVEHTADTVFITDREGVIEYVNPAFETTTGYPRAEAVGQTPRILKSGHTSPQQYAELWKTVLAGETYRSHILNRKKNGEIYHAEQTITPVKAPDGNIVHFVAVVKDMTDRFKRQAQDIEMQYASQIQQKLYPAAPPQVEGYDLAGTVLPAQATCGDYFDYVPLAGSGLGLVIGDVCGHGLGPALIMAATRSYVRFLSASCSHPGQIFETINDVLCADLQSNHYVAMVLVGLDVRSNRLSCANAGHVSGYHLDREGGTKTVLASTGLPLGMFPGQKYECHENLTLETGDLVVLFTDGISEAEDSAGGIFGAENALNVIRAHRHEPAEQIVQHLCGAVHAFVGSAPQQDDITVVVCRKGSFS